MDRRNEIVIRSAALVGSALLIWKGWQALLQFLHNLIVATMTPDGAMEPVLPSFLVVVLGFALVAMVQVVSIWIRRVDAKSLGILRGCLLVMSASLAVKAVGEVVNYFNSLAMAGTAPGPEVLDQALQSCAPWLYAGIAMLCMSTIFAAGSARGKIPAAPAPIMQWIETAGWSVALLLLASLSRFYARIDRLWENRSQTVADPAFLAEQISGILVGQTIWLVLFVPLGLMAIVAAMMAKPQQGLTGES